MVDEHGGELPGEGTATTVPVPGPTATPTLGATAEPTSQADCTNNQPPAADAGGPYNAMMGKGQAFVALDGSGSSDPDGRITDYEWDFGDGNTDSGQKLTYGYSSTGVFTTTLTVTDNCGAMATDAAQVTIVGPTPPASGSPTPSPTSQSNATPAAERPPSSGSGTPGFCYRVQPGNTLSGIAWYFAVPVEDLAAVNNISPEYFVIAGQGLFIPGRPPQPGPNFYEVQPGDTFYSIAFQCGLPAVMLADANGVTPDEWLDPGQTVMIPLWSGY
jgi:LysM repeat protein